MPVERPTFSETWYRVAELKPRLRAVVQTYRQYYRGQMYHVLRDQSNNQFFRLNEPAYHFVGLLDGKRTVAEVWDLCNQSLGDSAPTQGEVIQMLGQLYASNLLAADLPADSTGMFERYRKRIRREVTGYLTNILFVRIPLIDPEKFLDRWVGVVGWIFSWWGFIPWLFTLLLAGSMLAGHTEELFQHASTVLVGENLIWLTVSFWIIKALHEFGHGFACKKFGRDSQSGGEVHTMGIMLLVLMPVPYVDASSSWGLRNKWQRAMIGAAGMYVELFIAALAAMVWVNTKPDTLLHAITYNMMFIASVSTLLFNGNPLLRFDAYYILSDLLELPNLAQRSKEYLYYLVKKYLFGVRQARTTTQTFTERCWLAVYGVASSIYRIFISIRILLFIASQLLGLGIILGLVSIVMWVFVPIGKFLNYLATSNELMRCRQRATLVSVGFFALIFVSLGLIDVPDRDRAVGIVEPRTFAVIHMGVDGFISGSLDSDTPVQPQGPLLLDAYNPELSAQRLQWMAERRATEAQHRAAQLTRPAEAQSLKKRLEALDTQIARVDEQLALLQVKSPVPGVWVAPEADRLHGAFLRRGERLGVVASLDDLVIRATTSQNLGPRIASELGPDKVVEMRVQGNPRLQYRGVIERISPAGENLLPSQALSTLAGGATPTTPDDPRGLRTTEMFFEIRIKPDAPGDHLPPLLAGQRVLVRFELEPKPLGWQWWRDIRQVFQRRFGI